MSSSMKDISKVTLGAVLGVTMMVACGSAPSQIRERIIDPKTIPANSGIKLRGSAPQYDKDLDWCKSVLCFVFEDRDIRTIKNYISELEQRLKECQK
jgi:hypothetical protein